MQLNTQIKTRLNLSKLVGLILVGMLSACGGSGGGEAGQNSLNPVNDPIVTPPIIPPGATTPFDRLGLDVQLFSNTPSNTTGFQLGATFDSSANITFTNAEQIPGNPTFNYNFTFPSGLAGGSLQGNLFTISKGAVHKEINILTPSITRNVQNVFWRDSADPSLFGFGLPGYVQKLSAQNWPANGTAKYVGKAFQYIIDSTLKTSAVATYALFTSEVTATVDYSAKKIDVVVAPNPQFINSVGNVAPAVDLGQIAANYTLTNLDLSGNNFSQSISETQPLSGLGLAVRENALGFFGKNAEELGGVIHYSGSITAPSLFTTRDQFISFALVKQ
ncbi:MAG: hypothetical protein K0R08_2156 [Solimicrobium sp.]|jgi:hypothetical protein|nr:hypothetical protein [Solimicrobium sp.]